MRLSDGEARSIIASDVLNQIEGAFPPDFNFAHMADVKQSRSGSRSQMLRENAGVFDRHIPPAEVDHPGAQAPMCGVQCGLPELSGGRRSHSGFSVIDP